MIQEISAYRGPNLFPNDLLKSFSESIVDPKEGAVVFECRDKNNEIRRLYSHTVILRTRSTYYRRSIAPLHNSNNSVFQLFFRGR